MALCYALCTQPKANHDKRIKTGLLATVFVFCAIFLLPAFGIQGWAALLVALLALCVAAVSAAFIQCSIFGIAAPLPSSCAEGYMSGQAIAGTVASAAQLLSIYSASGSGIAANGRGLLGEEEGDDPAKGADLRLRLRTAIYFICSALFLLVSAAVWSQLNRSLSVQQQGWSHDAAAYQELAADDEGEEESGGGPAPALITQMRDDSPRLQRRDTAAFAEGHRQSGGQTTELGDIPGGGAGHSACAAAGEGGAAEQAPALPRWLSSLGLENAQLLYATFVEIAPFVYISAIVMGVTLAVFPPLTEAIVSSPDSSPQISNLTAWHFLLFNVGDYLGRLSTQWVKCTTARALHWLNAARLLLIPVFLMFPTIATSPPTSDGTNGALALAINSDLLFLFLVLVLGWSNGWVATMALILGPKTAANKELAGSVLGFAMCIGLVIGALASYPILLVAGIS
ncbi:hypothetical protein GQ54DRAFT_295883 [Martensiomyces pterosporus]|nr:hypothetical protein GQ54DRAFT_295883 [Martensiomyces pterosporus]